jgi:hypothetical protein
MKQVEKALIKDGNLKPLLEWYGSFDEASQRILEEVTIRYLYNFNRNLIAIMSDFLQGLYEGL